MKTFYKFTIAVIFAVAVAAASTNIACAQTPSNRSIFFDIGWRFTRDSIVNAEQPNFNDSKWRVLDLPHDWSIEGEISAKNPSGGSGGYLPTGIGWYRKTFKVPNKWKG